MSSQQTRMNNVIAQAQQCEVKMPWERGMRRQAMISRRLNQSEREVKVSLPPMPAYMTEAISA